MKLDKITLIVSSIVFSVLTILSVIFNFVNDTIWGDFVLNWCVGISCSIFVVITTTLIQFKLEQKKIIEQMASKLRLLFLSDKIYGYSYQEDADLSNWNDNQISLMEQRWLEEMNNGTYELGILADEYG